MKRKKVTFKIELIVPELWSNSSLLMDVKITLNQFFYRFVKEKAGVEKIEILATEELDN